MTDVLPARASILLVGEVDWSLLRQQKDVLLAMRGALSLPFRKHNYVAADAIGALDGVISMIDTMQDNAVDACGVPHEDVFGIPAEEESGD
jgi:hypothetical protein